MESPPTGWEAGFSFLLLPLQVGQGFDECVVVPLALLSRILNVNEHLANCIHHRPEVPR